MEKREVHSVNINGKNYIAFKTTNDSGSSTVIYGPEKKKEYVDTSKSVSNHNGPINDDTQSMTIGVLVGAAIGVAITIIIIIFLMNFFA